MNIHKEDLFFILFPPISIISTFTLMGILTQFNNNVVGVFYFTKLLFWFLSIMIALFTLKTFKIIDGIVTNKRKVYFFTIILSVMFIYYISLFQVVTSQHVFLIDLFSISLPVNIILSVILSLIVHRSLNKKVVPNK